MGKQLNDRLTEICGGVTYEDTEQEVTEDVTFNKNAYINTGQAYNNDEAVDLNSPSSWNTTDHAIVNLNAGDRLDIRGIGGGNNGGRLWALLDKTTHKVLSISPATASADLPLSSPISATVTADSDCIAVIVVYNEAFAQNGTANPYANTAHTPYYAKVTRTVVVPVGTPIDGILGEMQETIEENTAAIQENTEAIEELTPYRGLKYVALGDSITYGYIPRNAPGYEGQLNSYAKLTAQRLGMTFVNAGISGSSITNISGRNPMCVRYANLPDDADIITVMGGTNDITNGAVLGTMADRGTNTFYGALHVIMQGLYTKYIAGAALSVGKKKKIIICTPIKRMDRSKENLANTVENNATVLTQWDTWIDAIKEVAAFYSFPVLDMYNLSELNPHLYRTLRGTITGYTGLYNPYMPDGIHPTQEGQEMMADLLVGFLKGLK